MSTLYVVEQIDERGHAVCDVAGWLVLARDADHAVRLVEANGDDLEGEATGLYAEKAEWTRDGDPPLPLVTRWTTIHYGIWRPGDAVLAGYGFMPEDWTYCGCCGIVRHEEDEWANEGDDCDECERDAALFATAVKS
jgi:hypothetical protein